MTYQSHRNLHGHSHIKRKSINIGSNSNCKQQIKTISLDTLIQIITKTCVRSDFMVSHRFACSANNHKKCWIKLCLWWNVVACSLTHSHTQIQQWSWQMILHLKWFKIICSFCEFHFFSLLFSISLCTFDILKWSLLYTKSHCTLLIVKVLMSRRERNEKFWSSPSAIVCVYECDNKKCRENIMAEHKLSVNKT